jgi:hypothetical protein
VAGTRAALWLAAGLVATAGAWLGLALDSLGPRHLADAA